MSDDLQNVETVPAQAVAETPVVITEAPPVEVVPSAPVVTDPVAVPAAPDNVPENPAPTGTLDAAPPPASQIPVAAAPAPPSLNEKFSINLGKWKEHLFLAMAKRKEKWQKKLDKVLTLAQSQGTITNSQVKKLLRCTKLTAWRYLKTLEKQGKIRRVGGHNIPTYELVK